MQFMKICGTTEKTESENEVKFSGQETADRTAVFNRSIDEAGAIFLVDCSQGTVEAGLIDVALADVRECCDSFFRALEIPVTAYTVQEILFDELSEMLGEATKKDYIHSAEKLTEQTGLQYYNILLPNKNGEKMIAGWDKELIYRKAGKCHADGTLLPELDRIFTPAGGAAFLGHPVHYLIETDSAELADGMQSILLEALYANGRLQNKRYAMLSLYDLDRKDNDYLQALYMGNIGGAVVLKCDELQEEQESPFPFREEHNPCRIPQTVKAAVKIMTEFRRGVLTVLYLRREDEELKRMFSEALGSVSIVAIREDSLCGEDAVRYVSKLAGRDNLIPDEDLTEGLDGKSGHLAAELNRRYDEWLCDKLKTGIYSQYRDVTTIRSPRVSARQNGSAYEELQRMIGLEEAKKTVDRILNFHKAQFLLENAGIRKDRPGMHMVFTGNPGTAKTSTARLIARILRDNGILPSGGLHEVGRADLVGIYIGATAKNVTKCFKEAKGGVLFIDEAYSLVDDRNGSFGDEAINTIVQEMENHRNDTVVIFAGYADRMDEFLNRNPGLRSRISHFVSFDDYDTGELCRIASSMIRKEGYLLTDDAVDKLYSMFASAGRGANSGNGRYARNVVDLTRLAQADRLVRESQNGVVLTKDAVKLIRAEDIVFPCCTMLHENGRAVGF